MNNTVPEIGEAAIIPADGARDQIFVRRDKETGEWTLSQLNYTVGSGGNIKLSKHQLFALRTLLSQDSWS